MKKKILVALISVGLVAAVLFQVIPVLADAPNALDHIVITPAGTTLPVGGVQQFSAQAYGSGNQPLSNVTYFWLVTAGGGTINPTGTTGVFTAGAVPGTYPNTVEVLAVQGATVRIATASVTVTGTPGALDHVAVTPANATMAPGGTQQFTAQAYDVNNVAITGLNYSWSVVFGGGTITNVNNNVITFTAGTTTGTFANTIQVSTAPPAPLRTGIATVTITAQPAPTPVQKFDANKLIKMFSSYFNNVGFDRFLGGQWQVKNGAAVDTIKLIPGVVQAIPSATSPTLTIIPNGQAAAVTFTLGSNVVIQPKRAALVINSKVVVVTVNDAVRMVAVVAPVPAGQMPPGLKKQDDDKREGKRIPPGWFQGKKTGWGEKPHEGDD